MKTTTTLIVKQVVEIDLQSIPAKDWPEEARRLARDVLMQPRNVAAFQALPLAERKDWLITRIEALNEMERDFFDLANNL